MFLAKKTIVDLNLINHRLWRWSCTGGYTFRKTRRLNGEDINEQIHAETQ
jgi:hypothetical protein